jgi:alcohol dehydrogenase YqhD (iron-dependent ADH family)
MHSFQYQIPTEIHFGKDTEGDAPELIRKYGGSRIMIVYGGGSVVRSGLLERVTTALDEAGLSYVTLGGVHPNPHLEFAREGVKKAIQEKVDFLLAIGGGSVIDTAKAIAHGTANPETDIWEFWQKKAELTKSMPVGVILTISAAGSETSDSAVLTNLESGQKRGLSTPLNRPVFAIMNPELTYTLPAFQIACGVADIMMHTMDRYFNPITDNQLTDEIAEALLRTVIENGRTAVIDSHDAKAMSELMWAGSLSHNGLTGLGGQKDFAPHQLGHELSARFDVAHGASLTAVWGSWARYVYRTNPARFAQFADRVWGIHSSNELSASIAGIHATEEFFESIGMPTSFTRLGIGIQTEETLRELARGCSYDHTRTVGTFQVLKEDDLYEIYKAANN